SGLRIPRASRRRRSCRRGPAPPPPLAGRDPAYAGCRPRATRPSPPCLRAFRAASTPALCSREMGASNSRLETKLLAVLAASFVAGILFWHTWPLYPFKLLVVLMHESGHAAATLLSGGSVQRIHVDPQEGGYTLSLYAPSLWRQVLITSGRYVGSAVSGRLLPPLP